MPRIKNITPVENSGLDAASASAIFEQMARFAGYGFNKSHAAAYAAVSFQTAWLKTHHPEAFFASAMNQNYEEVEDIAVFATELKARNIPLWAPSINASRALFEPLKLKQPYKGRNFGICYSFAAIRGVGVSAAAAIEAERRRAGAFATVEEFSRRMGSSVNRTAMIALAKAGAFDCLGTSRVLALAEAKGKSSLQDAGQLSMFDAMNAAPVISEDSLSEDDILDNELDVLGHYMTAHPLDSLRKTLFEDDFSFSGRIVNDPNLRARRADMPAIVLKSEQTRTSTGKTMGILKLSDPDGTYEVQCFDETWANIRHLTKKKTRAIFTISIRDRDGERRLTVEDACPLHESTTAAAA